MTSLAAELSRIAAKAFADEGLPENFGQVQVSDRPDLAQFQCNWRNGLPRRRRKTNPRDHRRERSRRG